MKYLCQVTSPLYRNIENLEWLIDETVRLGKKNVSSAIYTVVLWDRRPTEHIVLFREYDEDEKGLNLNDLYDEEILLKRKMYY